jgi:transposase
MNKARGNKTRKATREARKNKVIAGLKEGKSQVAIAAEIGVSTVTLWRYLKDLDGDFFADNRKALSDLKRKVGEAQLQRADEVLAGTIKPEVANAWRGIISDFAKLFGLNAEKRAVVAHVSTDKDATYLKFKKAVSGLGPDQLDQVLAFATNLPREPKPVVKDASWFPAPEPKLLKEGDADDVA